MAGEMAGAEVVEYRDSEYVASLRVALLSGVVVKLMFPRDDLARPVPFLSEQAVALLPPDVRKAWLPLAQTPAEGEMSGPPPPPRRVDWRVETRPHSYAYEEGENFGAALAEIRKELGFETTDEFSAWIYSEDKRLHGPSGDNDVVPVLLDAFEYPALGWEQAIYVIECVARALNVSPGTLLDELHLRSSGRYRADGSEIPEE